MSDDVTQQDEVAVQDDAAAMESLMAGYNGTARAEEAPAGVDRAPQDDVQAVVDEPIQQEPSAADELKAQLSDLRAQVKALASTSDPETVRRMHGEIGEINRTLKQMVPAQAEPAPVKDELTAALEAAEEAAQEFPEIAGPLVKALKASITAREAIQAPQQPDIGANVLSEVDKRLKSNAIEALAEEHPDFETVRETPEFQKWIASKTPEYQTKLSNTWNPAVVSRGLTEFKESLKVRQKKQDRLSAAVVPQGTPQKVSGSTIPDEDGLMIGYNSGPKRQIHR